VARHADASQVDVRLEASPDEVVLEVSDDGTGIPAGQTRRSGLANLAARARVHAGSLRIEAPPAGGTRAVWTVRP
jgi:signal transduction histidine kinase